MQPKTKVVSVLWLWLFVNYLDRVALSFAGPVVMQSLGISASSFGLVLSAFTFGYLASQIPGGILVDRWGARMVLAIGPLFWALFTGLTGLVSTLSAFIAVRVLFGIAEGLSMPAVHRAIGDHFEPRERAGALAKGLTALALAPAIAGPFVGKLLSAFSWQWMFALLAIPAIIVSIAAQALVPAHRQGDRPADHEESSKFQAMRQILREPPVWLLACGFAGFNMGFWGYIGWMPSYLALARHIDIKSAGALAGLPFVFAFLGLIIWGWLGSGPFHRKRPYLMVCSLLGAGVTLAFAYRAESLAGSLAGLSGAAFFLYGCQGSLGAIILDLAPPAVRGTYFGLISAIGAVGGLLAPAIVGVLVDRTGTFASGFAFMVGALAFSAISMFLLAPYVALKNSAG